MLNYLKSKLFGLYKKMETREHSLQYLFMEITRRCNLNCLHCGSDCTASTSAPELDTESWMKIIQYIRDHFGTSVGLVITGGEPLLHPDLERLGAFIHSLEMRWAMVTNGVSLSEKRFESLQKAGIYSITVSIDGQEGSHNYLRNRETAFKKALSALEIIGNSDIAECDVVTCVYPGNLKELDAIAEILIEKKIPAWRLFRIFPSGRAANNPSLTLTYEQTWEMLNWIVAKRPHYKKLGLEVSASCEGYVPFGLDRKIREFPFFCRAGINFAAILCDGHITGCSNNHCTFYQGNILRDDFLEIWKTKFQDFRERKWVEKTVCAGCKHVKDCQGGSIHLWNLEEDRPKFCYMQDMEGPEKSG